MKFRQLAIAVALSFTIQNVHAQGYGTSLAPSAARIPATSVSPYTAPAQLHRPVALSYAPNWNAGVQPVSYAAPLSQDPAALARYYYGTAPVVANTRPSLAQVAPLGPCSTGQSPLPYYQSRYAATNPYYAAYSANNTAYWSSTQPRQYYGQSLFGVPTVYDKQQPLRNVLRFFVP